MSSLDEHGLIARHFRPLATAAGAHRLLDDAASYAPPRDLDLVLTKDGIAEGVHFPAGEAADLVARKALRVNLSDLAAKGARPVGYLVLLGLPDDWSEAWIAGFAAGLAADQHEYAVELYGGDTIRSGRLVISITAFGTVPPGGMVRRSGAQPGDRLYVSGTIGDGALGLRAATGDPHLHGLVGEADRIFLADRYRLPRPRMALAEAVRRFASAALDVSDGLAGDLDKLCTASGVTAEVAADRVPLSAAAAACVAADRSMLDLCLTGGDDYEILAAVPSRSAPDFESAAMAAGVPVSCIGDVRAGAGPARFVDVAGQELRLVSRSFSHVRTDDPLR
ncbi:thiamine-phosphate kinase [Tepidamorphus gemmatus]|uniref:Thiamine-monophosphate kinase n=1 Tax=Tepidamorphus gemmatus TaxID=747076 RepID=A0A4V2UZM1_9HYPH|nr:thiamine-phosphate kinase [Tepidamorphus gemmatus]TCT11488.1 thiamine-phosphate kinase [Tepidamorphus gemmatus]